MAETAKHRKNPSRPLARALELGIVNGPALDWGCGRGADLAHLKSLGFQAAGFDPKYRPQRPPLESARFRYAQCAYVLNTLPTWEDRERVINEMALYLEPGSKVMVATRHPADVNYFAKRGSWQRKGEGFITGSGSYQRGIHEDELGGMLEDLGFDEVKAWQETTSTLAVGSVHESSFHSALLFDQCLAGAQAAARDGRTKDLARCVIGASMQADHPGLYETLHQELTKWLHKEV
jgi:hypothetical protein